MSHQIKFGKEQQVHYHIWFTSMSPATCSVLAGLALFAFVDLRLTKGAGEAGFAIALDLACLGLPNTILTVTVLLAVETH